MPTTLKAIRREMLARNQALGTYFNLASATTTTAVVTALNVGGFTQGRFYGRFMVRAEAATAAGADRVRRITDFTASTGTFTHAGTNYADTTATSEFLEVLEYEPWLYDRAINLTLARLKRRDRRIIPQISGVDRYYIGNLTWIEQPSDILEVKWSSTPVLSNNRDFQKWNTVSTSGTFITPDDWTIDVVNAGAGRSTTQVWKGTYSMAAVRSGADVRVSQQVGLLENGVSDDSLRGEQVTAVSRLWTATASATYSYIDDGPTDSTADSHTGNSTWQEIVSDTHTISSSATMLEFGTVVAVNSTVYIGEAFLVLGTLTDAARRGFYAEHTIELEDYSFDQGAGILALRLPPLGRGSAYILYSKRPYPQFDETRLLAGTADADETDAPKELVAIGAIARLYEILAQRETDNERKKHYEDLAGFWEQRFRPLAQQHLGIKKREPGVDFMRPRALAMAPRRF